MENASTFTTFILDGYLVMDQLKPLYFTVFLLLYVAIVLLNSLLIAVIYNERTLHNPMYILVCHLSVNGIYGSSSLIPHLLFNLATQFHKISLANCLIQTFCLHTFNIIEVTILAVMGYDRYIAICHPLHYHSLMSHRKLQILVIFMWVYPLITFLLYEALTIRLTFCSPVITKTHCVNFELIKLSCTDITVHSVIGLVLTMTVFTFPQMLLILFSYAQILQVCLFSSKESKTKAVQTCTPHLLAVLNYLIGVLFEVIQSRFHISYLSYDFRTFMSLYFMIFPPLVNPIIYGMSGQVIRNFVHKFFFRKKVAVFKH
ncbi:olfactory receptor 4B13-like [Salminus brasiliensis]|uniref:olfactory receptor 4B13-like n=1 Tax=Salminus brasiliensis TaxID=930266 RepID=UPI003B8323AA